MRSKSSLLPLPPADFELVPLPLPLPLPPADFELAPLPLPLPLPPADLGLSEPPEPSEEVGFRGPLCPR